MDTPDNLEVFSEQADTVLTFAAHFLQQSDNGIDFLQRFREIIPTMVTDFFTRVPEEEMGKAAFWMGFSIWNAAPQADNTL